jgi:hypothetical protein
MLTIFGEKWPGAIKYRDIFDALSGSLFKLTLQTGPMAAQKSSSHLPQLNMDTEPVFVNVPQHGENMPDTIQDGKPSMSHMVTDAVKEAFMEVDEEAPGGWQGWRMWNEMVRDETTPVPGAALRFDSTSNLQHDMSWTAYENTGMYGVDPVQDAAMQMGNQSAMDTGQWSFGTYR